MASPELAIAKAALSATLFRADPTSLSRPAVDAFFNQLSTTLARCSRPYVQKCKQWIVENIAPSNARTTALAKYSLALSKNQQDDGQRPSVKRRRLHLLYVLNDVFFQVVVRNGDKKFGLRWEVVLPALVASAADFEMCPKHIQKIQNLIGIWEQKQYFSLELIARLKEAATNGGNVDVDTQPFSENSIKLSKDTPYVLPSFHGDSSTPWYDLPAATWLPHITPNSAKPMIPSLICPIQFAPGPADKALASAVQTLIADVDRMFSKEASWREDPHADINELGERVVLDEITKEIIDGDTYYGWSRPFCARMKERAKRGGRGVSPGRRSRSRSSRWESRSPGSRSASPPAFKRRRFSSSSRSRSRSRRRDQSYSRSPNRGRQPSTSNRRRSYSRSASPVQRGISSQPRGRSPPPSFQSSDRQPSQPPFAHPPPNMPPMPLMPPMGAFPVPPPRPPGHTGPWPPPPPPLPMEGGATQNWFPNPPMMPPMMGGRGPSGQSQVPLPPPPPPPSGYQGYQDGYGRGRGNVGYRGRGRGAYSRGYRGN
ncbi:hypothetical protein S40285_02248 [Stachybotrys chlorohalonatus IBT 40285]|uniref:CID domain-containing protein n=1 Tax=Stachybotrys chlorohalonatus (strain IBT 40285) TaxID=1283841 RepID=A0A084QFW7_STAC4|nr:hypothetical protein S40285_02248 [Stachybotrys chlorohalonata IBT 40285]